MATLKNVTINDTGFVKLAAGNTAERPGTPTSGMMRYNTDYNRNEIYDGAKWVLTDGSNHATGGTVTTVGGYRIHTFTTVGATSFTMTYPGTVEVMLVGGGGGGAGIGGGGGAGGFIYESQLQLTAGAYTINVGGGGGGEPSHNSLAAPGSNSSIVGPALTNITAIGGGRGLPYARSESPSPHGYGGSGGGGPGAHGPGSGGSGNGAYPQAPMGHGNDPFHFWHEGPTNGYNSSNNRDQIDLGNGPNAGGGGVTGQGHPGGAGAHGGGYTWVTNSVVHAGGGGGGAGSHGKPALNSNTSGQGGAGLASQISGTLTYYAGGGGNGTHGPSTPGHYGLDGAMGGVGGGGRAGIHPGSPNGAAANGVAGGTNTGGGGGGGVHGSPNVAGGGGPGIVIVRYRDV
jgi:hypothetical protein